MVSERLAPIVAEVADAHGIEASLIYGARHGGLPEQARMRARAVVFQFASRRLGMSKQEVARELGVDRATVHYVVAKTAEVNGG